MIDPPTQTQPPNGIVTSFEGRIGFHRPAMRGTLQLEDHVFHAECRNNPATLTVETASRVAAECLRIDSHCLKHIQVLLDIPRGVALGKWCTGMDMYAVEGGITAGYLTITCPEVPEFTLKADLRQWLVAASH